MEYYHNIIMILAGLIVVGFVVYQLYLKFKPFLVNGKWYIPMLKTIEYMAEAEAKFDNGTDRKIWVMDTLKDAMSRLNIEVNYDAIGNMIDAICALAKVLNHKK